MIDPHVHLRDWEERHKETLEHGLWVAYAAGLDAVFEMPNTKPALTSLKTIEKRILEADHIIRHRKLKIFHGLYAGITPHPKQIEEVVRTHDKLFPRVAGLKMFAGQSTGNMGIIKEDEQKFVFKILAELGYKGVLAIHCEKEKHFVNNSFNPENPITHTYSRPALAEYHSIADMISFAYESGFSGTLHIPHISHPDSLKLVIRNKQNDFLFDITCGLTPHHALIHDRSMEREDGLLYKMNPPLRSIDDGSYMLNALIKGDITWIETDHAPHMYEEKIADPYPSGIPVLHFYPHFIKKYLEKKGVPSNIIKDITHNNIIKTFKMEDAGIKNTYGKRKPNYDLVKHYENTDVFRI